MSEINIIRDEQQKLEASQLPESLMEKQNVFARKFKDRRPGHSKDNYLENRKGKVYQLKPDSNLEWIRETIIDPSKRDNRVLIDVEKYCKKQDLNIIEIQEKHYREFIANHHQVNEVDVDFPETQNKEANANIKNVVKTVKKNKLVKEKTRKAVGHLTTSSGARRDEFPVKSELDLGCFPQFPLLDVDKFKNFHFENGI